MKKCSRMNRVLMFFLAMMLLSGGVCSIYAAETEDSPLLMRMRTIGVIPYTHSSTITGIGGHADVDGSVTGDLDFSYFFTKNIATELTLAITQHNVDAKGTALGDVDLGDVWLLPPTLTVQYHFCPDAQFRPYVGTGVNYTMFFHNNDGVTVDDVDYDDSFGWALQAGFDIGITKDFAINFDVKKIYLESDVKVKALNQTLRTDVDLDPWLVGFGFAYRFSCK